MSITQILQNGLSGITASQAGLATVSQNIANANTIGYSKQSLSFVQRVIDGVNSGVSAGIITRAVDTFLVRELQARQASQGEAEVVSTFYSNIQTRFGTPSGNNSLSADLSRFGAALETLSINPEDPALRFNVVSASISVARSINDLATSVQTMRRQADTGITDTVNEINSQLRTLFKLNNAITLIRAQGGVSAGLEDQRDIAVTALSKNISITSFTSTNGALTIMAEGGLTLLDTEVRELEYTPAAVVNEGTLFGAIKLFRLNADGERLGASKELVSSGVSSAVVSTVNGGRLKGFLDVRDSVLPDLGAQITVLADTVRTEYNAVHNSGSSFPAINSLTGTRAVTTGDAFAATGNLRIAVVNADGTLAVDAVDIDLTGIANVGDLAAAINTALDALGIDGGTAAIINGNLVIAAKDPTMGIAINDSLVTGMTQGFSHFFGLNDFFVGGATGTDFAVRPDIIDDPSHVSMGTLSLTATLVGESGISVGDNSVITALSSLTQKNVTFAAVAGLPAGNFILEDYAGLILGLNAVQAARAEASAELETDLLENLEFRKASLTGVNIDEELANILVFQNSFAASARVIGAAQELFDNLLGLVR